MADDTVVNKQKFDALLRKMIATPPTPHSEVKAAPRKPKGKKRG
jgi:hypothetical protein